MDMGSYIELMAGFGPLTFLHVFPGICIFGRTKTISHKGNLFQLMFAGKEASMEKLKEILPLAIEN